MKSKLEKRINKIVIGLMIPPTLVAIALFVKDCNYNRAIKKSDIKKEIKTPYDSENKIIKKIYLTY